MERRSELENRAFALQRLKETGYHIEVLYEAKEETKQAVENEIDKGASLVLPDTPPQEFLIYENNYQTARIVLDAITAVCLFDWLEQLKELNVNDSLTWKFVQQERQEKKNE